jgi:hypothetical protein
MGDQRAMPVGLDPARLADEAIVEAAAGPRRFGHAPGHLPIVTDAPACRPSR